ncbi:MAG: O-methyltransferase [Bacteroidetes bacterium]|nr:O-methyltransferase [Bacteroidota bacterium]
MDFLPPSINSYSESHTSPESEILKELNRETHAKVLMPRMLSGHLQGRMLSMISRMISPKTILEIGTYTGYSALCMAEGLAQGGLLHTIDINDELTPMVKKYVEKSGLTDSFVIHTGNALDIIPTLAGPFDLVFIDADKVNYSRYFNLCFDKVRSGGFIIADNVLWSGKVIDDGSKKDVDTKALMEFNDKVHAHKGLEHILLPLRDGLLIMQKK